MVVCHNPHSPKLGLKPPPAPPGDAAAGKQKAAACVDCLAPTASRLASKDRRWRVRKKDYLFNALKAYLSDKREADAVMKDKLGRRQRFRPRQSLAYYSSQKCESSLDAQKQSASPDAAVAGKCAECHERQRRKRKRRMAEPGGLFEGGYILKSLNAYKTGVRSNSMMSGVVQKLSDADANRAASYFSAAACE